MITASLSGVGTEVEVGCFLEYLIIDTEAVRCCLTLEKCECHDGKTEKDFEEKYVNVTCLHWCAHVYLLNKKKAKSYSLKWPANKMLVLQTEIYKHLFKND